MRLPNLELVEWVLLERKITEFEDIFRKLEHKRRDGNNKKKTWRIVPGDALIIIKQTRETSVVWRIDGIK